MQRQSRRRVFNLPLGSGHRHRRATSLMGVCNTSALVPRTKSSIAVQSPRLEIRTVRRMDLGRAVSLLIPRHFVRFVGTATWFNGSVTIDDLER
jgi:hypothetical protein